MVPPGSTRFPPSKPLKVDIALFGHSALEAISFPFLSLCPKGEGFSSLPGTSGDTGSAAIESVQGTENVGIIVLLPKGLCTKIQELQMTTVLKENVRVFGGMFGSEAPGTAWLYFECVCFGRWAGTNLIN